MNRTTVGAMGVMLCGLLLATSAQAALSSRLGGAAAYDDVLDITWLTDADLSGAGSWQTQVDWAANLDILGFDDWRLASMSVSAGVPTGTIPLPDVPDACAANPPACLDNELGYMFYENLGGTFGTPLQGNQSVGDVTLTDIQFDYWSGTDRSATHAYFFRFGGTLAGLQSSTGKSALFFGWAVRAGDVDTVVPIPASLLLMGSCLVLLGLGRSRRRV